MAIDEEYVVLLALQARDQALSAVVGVDRALVKMTASSNAARTSLERMSGAQKAIGVASAAVAVAVAGFFVAAEHGAAKYQEVLRTVRVNTGLTAAATDALGQAIDQVAVGTHATATDMAAALGPIAGEFQRIQGGALKAADATTLLSAAQDLTESSGGKLASSTKAITDLMLVYHEKVGSAAGIADTLFQAHAVLGIGTDRLAMMLQRLQPRIAGSGVSMKQLLGIVVQLTPAVGSGQRAIMQVGTLLGNLQSPTAAAQKLLAKLHVTITDSSGKFVGFGAALDKIKAAYDKLGSGTERNALLTAIFGKQAKIAQSLVEGGSKAIAAATKALDAHGTAAAAATLKDQTLEGQMELLHKTFATVTTSIGMVFLPAINAVFLAITPLVVGIGKWVTANPALAATILAVVGGLGALVAIAMYIVPIFLAGSKAIAALVSPLGLVIAAAALFGAAFAGIKTGIEPVDRLFRTLSFVVGAVVPGIRAFVTSILDLVSGRGSIDAVARTIGSLFSDLGYLGGVVVRALGDMAAALLDWARRAIPVFLDGLGQMAGSVIRWAQAQVPVWIDQLAAWTRAFVGWVAPILSDLLSYLGRLAAGVISWILDAVPGIVTTLVQWGVAFVGWVAPAIADLLAGLVNLGSAVLGWVGREAGVIAHAVGEWAGAAADWIMRQGIPAILGAFGAAVDAVVGMIGDGSTLARIADQLTTWTIQFISWARTTGLQIVVGLLAIIADQLVTQGPKLIGAAITAGANIVIGIARGIVENPGELAAAIGATLAMGVIFDAIAKAGALAGAAYAGGLRLVQTLVYEIQFAWLRVQTAVSEAILGAGGKHGLLYQGAVKVASVLTGIITAVWNLLMGSPAVLGAAAAAGTEEGTAFAAASAGAARTGGLMGLLNKGLGTVGIAAGTTAGGLFMGALGVGAIAAVAATYVQITQALNAQSAQIASSIGDQIKTGTLDQLLQSQAALKQGITDLGQEVGYNPLANDQLVAMAAQYKLVTARVAELTAAEIAADDARESRTQAALAGRAAATAGGGGVPTLAFPDLRASEVARAAGVMAAPIAAEMRQAHDVAVAVAQKTPGDIASALRSAQDAVNSGAAALAEALQSPVRTASQRIGELQAILEGKGKDTGEALKRGLASKDPVVRAAAEAYRQSIIDQIGTLQGAATAFGQATGAAYATGLASTETQIKGAALSMLRGARSVMVAKSPPGRESPLHEIDTWGHRTAASYVGAFASSLGGLPAAIRPSLASAGAGMAPRPAAATSFSRPAAAPNISIYLDGKRISGALSQILFDEERRFAGPANPLSPF